MPRNAGTVATPFLPLSVLNLGMPEDEFSAGTPETWRAVFGQRSGQHRDVALAGIRADSRLTAALGPSVATFQLGESGTGEHLLAAASSAGTTPDYIEALRLFVIEEQEHARLLELVLRELKVEPRTRHWSDTVFVQVRRLHSLRTEVLVLLVAEVIALNYYSSLCEGVEDPSLADLFRRIHDDEIVHVRFHTDTLPRHLDRFPTVVLVMVRLAWSGVVTAASVVVALDHGSLLRRVGVNRREFLRRTWTDRSQISQLLFGSSTGARRRRRGAPPTTRARCPRDPTADRG